MYVLHRILGRCLSRDPPEADPAAEIRESVLDLEYDHRKYRGIEAQIEGSQ